MGRPEGGDGIVPQVERVDRVAGAAGAGELPRAQLPAADLPLAFWLMAALASFADARPFTPPGRRQTLAVFPSVCLTFAILLAWGLGAAVLVAADPLARELRKLLSDTEAKLKK